MLQILTMQQTALVLVHTDPGKPIQHLLLGRAERFAVCRADVGWAA